MGDELQALFDAVRQACKPAVWSRGVELTRADAVVVERIEAAEAAFRIALRGGIVSPRVLLYLDDAEWECECRSREPACEHVAAAVIAWRQAREAGADRPQPRVGAGRVAYRFTRQRGGLALERAILRDDGSVQPLETTLAAVASGRVAGPRFVASQADLAAELALGTHRRGVLPPAVLPRLLRALAHCSDLELDGRPVGVATEPILPRVLVEDQGDGFRVTVLPPATLTESFANRIALCGAVLRPIGETRLTAREQQDYAPGRYFAPDEAAALVTEVLPDLGRRLPLDVRTSRLPATEVEPPRIVVETEVAGEALRVMALLVYGDPPRARIDGGRLVHLGGAVPLRDELAERQLVRRLASELGLAPGVRAELAGEAAVALGQRLARWGGALGGADLAAFRLAPALVPHAAFPGGRFELEFTSPAAAGAGGGRADPSAVLRAWREGASLVPLSGGGFAPLPADWLARYGHRVADLLAARQADGSLPACLAPEVLRLCQDLDQVPPPSLTALEDLLGDFAGLPAASLPPDLAVPLRPYQQQGVDWLVFLRRAGLGGLLADDMGLGKTLQALCAVQGRTLVVCPTSVLHNWADEIRKHRPALSSALYHGPRRELDPEADVTLTTYAILRLDAARLAREPWDTVVLDEAQNVKNPESQVAAAAHGLPARFRVALTGTPVENRLDELWSQLHFVNRGLLGGRRDFEERYAGPIARGDLDAAARLRARIRPFVLRRLKREVAADLPPRTEMVLRCELTADERQVYDAVRAASLAEVGRLLAGGGGGVMAALEALLRLRQAACHAALVPGQRADGSSKVALLLETLDSVLAEGHRALVFSQWTSLIDLVEPHLGRAGIAFVRLDGTTRDRQAVVASFQQPDGPPVMLVSLKAGGTGLNLTAADHVFLMDPWWNPAVEDQAADRAHRIGQERPVMIYRLVAADTVEERILALQSHKRELAALALEGSGGAAGLTRDDLLELLR